MTALDKYQRLESGGIWRADEEAQRKDVVISFGDATLVISDSNGRPLAHWSLPAISRQNPGKRPAVFAPDEDGSELVELADDLMIDAIEEVRKALDKARPKPGKLRHWITGGSTLAVVALGILWLPGALLQQTLSVVPPTKRIEIGNTILAQVQSTTGAVCREPRALEASSRLASRLFGQGTAARVVVLPQLTGGSAAIPGGLILLDHKVLQSSDDPAVAAGYLLLAHAMASSTDPLEEVLQHAGLGPTFRLLMTGDLPPEVLAAFGDKIAAGAVAPPDGAVLSNLFHKAGVQPGPFVATAKARGEPWPALDELTSPDAGPQAILNDSDWVSLQNICNI